MAVLFFFIMGRRGTRVGQAVRHLEPTAHLPPQRGEIGTSGFIASPSMTAYPRLRGQLGVGLLSWALPPWIYGIYNVWVSHCNFLQGLGTYSFVTLPALFHGLLVGFFLGVLCPNRKRANEGLAAYFLLTAVITLLEGILRPRVVPHNLILGVVDISWLGGRSFLTDLAPSYYWHRVLSLLLSFLYFLLAVLLLLRRIGRSREGPTKKSEHPLQVPSSWEVERFYVTRLTGALILLLMVAGLFPEETGLAIGSNSLRRHLSQVKETEHFILYVEPGSPAAENIARLAEEHEWYYHQIQQLLGRRVEKKILSYVYSSEEQKQKLTGLSLGTWLASPFTHSIHVAYEDEGLGSVLKHEIAHIFEGQLEKSWRFWAFPPLSEGLAEMIEEEYWRGGVFHEDLAAARRVGVLTPAEEVMTFQGFGLGRSAARKSYEVAGSFCGFLFHRYGIERLLSLCRTLDYEESFGKSLQELNREWLQFLEAVPVRPEVEQRIRYEFDDTRFPPFYRRECPRLGRKDPFEERAALAEQLLKSHQFPQARALFADLARQGDPSGRFRLREIEALRRQGAYEEAIRLVEALYASPPPSVDVLNEILEVRARLYLQAHRFEEALKALDDWHALPYDIWGSKWRIALYRAILRHAQVSARLIDGVESSNWCSLASQNQYRQALKEDPSATPAHYLLVRCALEDSRAPIDEILQEHARKFLEEEPELGFAKVRLLRLLGERAFRTGHLDQALGYFEQLPRYDNSPTLLQEVEAWRERIAWNRQRGPA